MRSLGLPQYKQISPEGKVPSRGRQDQSIHGLQEHALGGRGDNCSANGMSDIGNSWGAMRTNPFCALGQFHRFEPNREVQVCGLRTHGGMWVWVSRSLRLPDPQA